MNEKKMKKMEKSRKKSERKQKKKTKGDEEVAETVTTDVGEDQTQGQKRSEVGKENAAGTEDKGGDLDPDACEMVTGKPGLQKSSIFSSPKSDSLTSHVDSLKIE